MSNEKDQKKGYLVSSSKKEIAKFSSALVSRGLELVKIVEREEECDLLIVDDEESIRFFLGEEIQDMIPNIRIQFAKNGLEASKKVLTLNLRIVWTCVKMPRMDGLRLIELIRRNPDLKNTKIILCTACYTMEDVRNRAFELGVNLFLPKGVKIFEEAATWVLRCMAFHTDDAEVGRYSEAIEAYKEAIRINPDYWEAHHGLGWVYSGLGRYKEAIEAYKQAIRIYPDDAFAHYTLGVAYLKVKNKSKANEQYEILKNLNIKKANALFNQIYK